MKKGAYMYEVNVQLLYTKRWLYLLSDAQRFQLQIKPFLHCPTHDHQTSTEMGVRPAEHMKSLPVNNYDGADARKLGQMSIKETAFLPLCVCVFVTFHALWHNKTHQLSIHNRVYHKDML